MIRTKIFKLFTMVMAFCLLGSQFEGLIPVQAVSSVRFINNAEDLIAFSEKYQSMSCTETVVLTADIVLPNTINNFKPICNFKGTFEGREHTISGLKISDENKKDVGLFASAENAEIRNVTVKNSEIVTHGQYAGAIVGDGNNVRLNNCHSVDNVISSFCATGGIAGRLLGNETEVMNCSNEGGSIASNIYPGGIVGSTMGSRGVIENCFNTAAVQGVDVSSKPGGISAYAWNIENCYNIGKMSTKSSYSTYAICANLRNYVHNCYYAEGIADASCNKVGMNQIYTSDEIEMMSASEMQQEEFIDMLNANDNRKWFTWVWREDTNYPVLAKCKDISDSEIVTISLPQSKYEYTGEPIEPAVKVSSDSEILGKEFDYVVTYENNIDVGTATVTVIGINQYSGTYSLEFTIESELNTEATTEATEQATTETTEQATTETTEQATTETPEQSTPETTEQSTLETTEQLTTETPEQATTETTEQATTETPEQATTETPEQATTETTEQATTETPEQATTQTTAQATTQTTEQATTQSTAQATTQTTEQSTTQSTAQATTKKTKKLSKKQKALNAYKIFLKNNSSNQSGWTFVNKFGLLDINKDGVPELITTSDNMYHVNIYGYVKGKVKDIGSAFSGKCEFYPERSVYYTTCAHSGDDMRSYYIYNGKKMKKVAYAYGCDYKNAITGKKKTIVNGFKPYKYVVKGKRVSKAKYDRYVKKLLGKAKKKKPVMKENNVANRNKLN